MTPTLTLTDAIDRIRQSEGFKAQNDELHRELAKDKVHRIQSRSSKFREKPAKQPQTKLSVANRSCQRCGKKQEHNRTACPAKEATCFKCQKRGHFASVCKTVCKSVGEVLEEYAYLGSVSTQSLEDGWRAKVKTEGTLTVFKVDTGADVTVIPEDFYAKNFSSNVIVKPMKRLCGPDRKLLMVKGMLQLKMEYKGVTCTENVYVVAGLEQPLLGKPAIEKMNIVNVRAITSEKDGKSKVKIQEEFPELFKGLGRIKGPPCSFRLKEGSKPFAVSSPRRIPLPLISKAKELIDHMVINKVVVPVKDPTEYCAPIVVVPRSNGKLRICIDYTELNKNLIREYYPIQPVEYSLAQLAGAKHFSKLDADWGFWQIELDEEASRLATIITPFGRFRPLRLPMGIAVAPEHFQRRMTEILSGVEGVICKTDDILVFANTIDEHDQRLRVVLRRLRNSGVTLNPDKCSVGLKKLTFLGHSISAEGISPDQEKIIAIQKIKPPTNKSELKTFLGMINFSGRFISHLADIAKPLNALLSNKVEWTWQPQQQKSLEAIKTALLSPPVLAKYDANLESVITADSSSYGLGAVLSQIQGGETCTVAYASRTLTQAERRYAQIEKEGLALSWACEKFHDYVAGKIVHLRTDHKSLVPLFSSKNLDDMTPRLQRIRMRLMRYHYSIAHSPGWSLGAADTLSRNPMPNTGDSSDLEEKLAAHIRCIVNGLPASDTRLQDIWKAQNEDVNCLELKRYVLSEWPEKKKLSTGVQRYWQYRYEIGLINGLLMKGDRLVIPRSLQLEILRRIHDGHLGITKCRARARESVWWPGIGDEIKSLIENCPECVMERVQRHMPLMPRDFPQRPWQRVALDLYFLRCKWYLVVTDYYSRYPEVVQLARQTTDVIVLHLKAIFSRHGIPEEVVSDNGPQLGREFNEFFKSYGFRHTTSSPKHPRSNGQSEAAVKVVKMAMKKNEDLQLA